MQPSDRRRGDRKNASLSDNAERPVCGDYRDDPDQKLAASPGSFGKSSLSQERSCW